TSANASQLGAGEHQVTITDKNGCTAIASVTITEDILPLAVSLTTTQAINCSGDNSGSLSAEVSGGKGPFTFAWSTKNGQDAQAAKLGAGNYQVTVTDVTGTQANTQLTLSAPDALLVTATAKASANTNQQDGKAKAEAKGGSGKYNYQWDTG
ncbi:MAG: SprB repeat-containing protein, partial [Bacteroidota bacterium]